VEATGVDTVFVLALLTALATGLGAVPFAFAKRPTRRWLGISNAVAAGLMLAASFGLIYEGVEYGILRTMSGALLGLAFIVAARRFLRQDELRSSRAWAASTPARRSRSSGS
jgi:ZIP family zinc transporter